MSIVEKIKDKTSTNNTNETSSIYYEYNGKQYTENPNLQLILCIGLDSYDNNVLDSYMNNELADCIVLLVLDKTQKTILPIQINRDTMSNYHVLGIGGKITNDTFGQIALSHSYGSGGLDSLINTKDAVSDLLCGIRIDDYMSLTMDAVAKINDKAGGVTVLVEDDFSGVDDTLIQGEEVTLFGDHALTFVRARSGMSDQTNINRINRQRVYLRALYDTCKEKIETDQEFVNNSLNSIAESIIANNDIYGLTDIGNTLLKYKLLDATQLKGESKKGDTYMEFYVDEDNLQEFCINTFYKEVKWCIAPLFFYTQYLPFYIINLPIYIIMILYLWVENMSLYIELRNQYGLNNPFLLKDISNKDNYDSVKVTINNLVKKNLVRRYTKGVYYLPKQGQFGELYPSFDEVIEKKYLVEDRKRIGYYTGIALLNNMGLTTQVPNTIEICTNLETNIKRKVRVDNLEVILRKPITNITNENVHYLQFIDVFRICNLFDLLENDKKYIKKYIKKYGLTKKTMSHYLDMAPKRCSDYMVGSGIFSILK